MTVIDERSARRIGSVVRLTLSISQRKGMTMSRGFILQLLLVVLAFAPIANAQVPGTNRRMNIILVLRDQTRFDLPAAAGYTMPALDRLSQRGITFRNHYIASAMCTPSRAALYSGQPPQVNGVFDQLENGWVPSLRPDRPNMGSMMKKLGYRTVFFGKWEMDFQIVAPKPTINYSEALQPYGFDVYQPDGDKVGTPDQGYKTDFYTAAEGVRWLRGHARNSEKPFFMVMSFVNPHDIMYTDANVPGTFQAQKSLVSGILTPPPANSVYSKLWNPAVSQTLTESLSARGMPPALTQYHIGWAGVLGSIPVDRVDMWRKFNNAYLNMIRDTDASLHLLEECLDELSLWENTVVIFTADHGEMAGDHGGLRGKGPFCYEGNSHVPMIIADPRRPQGKSCALLTSHLDLMPTLAGLSGVTEAERREAVKGLPGRDFSSSLASPETVSPQAVRPGVLFNYVAPLTIDSGFLLTSMSQLVHGKPASPLSELVPKLDKRGFMSFVYDGQYKFARYYSPAHFNAPQTLEQIMANNDLQLFNLKDDPLETHNLALDPQKYGPVILRMNALMNDLMAKEVGKNDGSFLPAVIRPRP